VAAWYRVELEVTPDRRHSPAAQTDIPMISKSIVFLFSAIALGGCCISGNGCYAPVAGAPIAWDGLGSPPTDVAEVSEDQPKKKKTPSEARNYRRTARRRCCGAKFQISSQRIVGAARGRRSGGRDQAEK